MAAQWNVISTFVVDQVFGYQTADKIRQNMLALASCRSKHQLGGSRQVALDLSAVAQNAIDWIDQELDSTNLAGFTVQARVECRTANAATAITPSVLNVTDAAVAVTGTACTDTNSDYSQANQKQTLVVPLAAGVKKYRLQGTAGNASNPTWLLGHLELFATA